MVSGTWTTQRIEHLYLEPEAALVEPRPEGGRSPSSARARASSTTVGRSRGFLGVDEDDIYVELVPNGGAFGGKEDMSIQAQTRFWPR